MNLIPLRNQVVVQRKEEEKMSAGGLLHIPTTAQKTSIQATVMAVGPGRTLDNGTKVPVDVKVGDTVLLGRGGGNEVEIDGVKYVIVTEDSILAVLS